MRKSHFHTIIGSSSTGKTEGIVVPQILNSISKSNSFIVTDPKNEILDYIGKDLTENHYKIICINLRNIQKSDTWNPLSLPLKYYNIKDYSKCYSLLYNIANIIFQQEKNNEDDPFWNLSARDLFVGLSFGLFEDKKSDDEVNLKSIYYMESIGSRRRGTKTLLDLYYDTKVDYFSFSNSCLRGIATAPNDTRNSIFSVFNQNLRAITMNEKFLPIICKSSFDIEECIKNKTAFILQYEDEAIGSSYIVNMFIQQIIELIINYNTVNNNRIFFDVYLDDFLSLEKLPNIDTMIISTKKRGINTTLCVNSINLLEKYYGKNTAYAILDNSDLITLTSCCDVGIINYYKELFTENKFKDLINELYMLEKHEFLTINDSLETKKRKFFRAQKKSINIATHNNDIDISLVPYFDLETHLNTVENTFWKPNITSSNNLKTNINVDDLIERIDKKIAELEEEGSET